MIGRKTLALMTIVSLALLCCGDLLAAGGRACGDHPCCVKGACKMMPKNGARLDRCGDPQASAPRVAPVVLTASSRSGWQLAVDGWQISRRAFRAFDGTSFRIDRPPRA